MSIERRTLLASALALAACESERPMYGLIGKMIAKPGQRDALIQILLAGGEMPGCRLYVVGSDPSDANGIWITEVWDTEAQHDASLQLPAVQAAITQARPLIEGFGEQIVMTPLGGIGLDR